MARAALRVVFYAVNGTGVGHITRLLAIARWVRRYAAALDQKIEIWFLTSSEAEGLAFAEGFAAFKIPSKTIVHESGIDRTAYLALAKQWIWHTLGLLRPDLLVVDTFPRGSFGELLGALDLCRHKAFVYRPVRREVAERADFQAMLTLYDLLLVPDKATPVLVPLHVKERLVHVGVVLGRERWELLPRDVARARLGVPSGARCVFVSAGGGGDRDAEAQLADGVRALAKDPKLYVVVGTGPLYRGKPFPGITIVPGRAAEWSLAFDAAISAAGYNTWSELMFAGVPTAFVPQDKLADDQDARAALAVDRGAGVMLGREWDGERVHAAVLELLARPGAREAAGSLVPESCARVAAAELLRLLVPAARVDAVEDALSDERLARILGHEADTLHVGHCLAHGADRALDLGAAIDRAASLVAGRDAHTLRELRTIALAVARGLPSSPLDARADACEALLAALGPLLLGDGAAARAAVADGRWGEGISTDGALLAGAMRQPTSSSSSSLLSTK